VVAAARNSGVESLNLLVQPELEELPEGEAPAVPARPVPASPVAPAAPGKTGKVETPGQSRTSAVKPTE
jgi:hypothetical protein